MNNYSKLENMPLVKRKNYGEVSKEIIFGAAFKCHARDFSEAPVMQS